MAFPQLSQSVVLYYFQRLLCIRLVQLDSEEETEGSRREVLHLLYVFVSC